MNITKEKWFDRLASLGLFALSLGALSSKAVTTGPAAGELVHWNAARSIGEWIERVIHGTGKFRDHVGRDAVLGALPDHGSLQAWISGLLWQLSFKRHRLLSELFALRAGDVLLSALSLPLVYVLVRKAFGRRIALLSSAFFFLCPRLFHELALAGGQGPVVFAWLLVLASFVAWQRSPTIVRMLLSGVCFGLGLAISPSTFALLPILVAASQWSARSEFRSNLATGRLPIPAPIVLMPALGGALWFALKPWLWHQASERLRLVFSDWISPIVASSLYQGQRITALPVPKWQSAVTSALSLPTLTAAFAFVGLVWLVYRSWFRRFSRFNSAAVVAFNSTRSSTLVALALIATFAILWPAVSPDVLTFYPARWILVMPFVACLSAVGFNFALRVLDKLFPWHLNLWRQVIVAAYAFVVLASLTYQAFRNPSTQVAAFPSLFGGAKSVSRSGILAVHDASIAKAIGPAIDSLGRPNVTIYSPDIPSDVWDALRQRGMLRTSVRPVASAKDAELVAVGSDPSAQALLYALWARRGNASGALAKVERDGCVILGLYKAQLP
jgi:hypothetical protein